MKQAKQTPKDRVIQLIGLVCLIALFFFDTTEQPMLIKSILFALLLLPLGFGIKFLINPTNQPSRRIIATLVCLVWCGVLATAATSFFL